MEYSLLIVCGSALPPTKPAAHAAPHGSAGNIPPCIFMRKKRMLHAEPFKEIAMVKVAIDEFGDEIIYEAYPLFGWWPLYKVIELPRGTIKKMTGRELTEESDPIILTQINELML